MDKPLVSLITISLNSVKSLEDSILSVINQDCPEIEYIIIDGGSTDGTVDIIRKYESKISKWVSEPDKGTSDAVNKGLRMASGEIIGLLNSDDYLEPNIITTVVKAFMEIHDADVIYGDLRYLSNEKGEICIVKHPADLGKIITEKILLRGIPLLLPAAFYKKSVFDRYGLFDLSYVMGNDSEFYLRLLRNGVKFAYIDKVIVNMRSGGNSDVNYKETIISHRTMLLQYGFNPVRVNLSFLMIYVLKILETHVGTLIRRMGFVGLIRIYRRIFYPEINSDEGNR